MGVHQPPESDPVALFRFLICTGNSGIRRLVVHIKAIQRDVLIPLRGLVSFPASLLHPCRTVDYGPFLKSQLARRHQLWDLKLSKYGHVTHGYPGELNPHSPPYGWFALCRKPGGLLHSSDSAVGCVMGTRLSPLLDVLLLWCRG